MFSSCCFFYFIVTIFVTDGISIPEFGSDTLELVHVLFRHGNRTPSIEERYPKDPYLRKTYFPFGEGQLTNAGKRREFGIGKELRQTYDSFLGQYYYPDIVDSYSTDFNRTKMSLMLASSGLFPPRGIEVWSDCQNWQPIPYNYRPVDADPILYGIRCPTYLSLYEEHTNSQSVQAEFKRNRAVFNYISRNTGLNVTTFEDVYDLYFGLSTEEEWGLKLPAWTRSVWPGRIIELAIQQYNVYMGTTPLRRIAAGYFLQKVINDSRRKINDPKSTRKIYLYSAHENNVATVLVALDIFEPHIPTYGSYISIEIHKMNNVHGVKIYYQNYTTEAPRLMKLPACAEFCPLDQFSSILEEFMPSPNDCGI